MDKDSLSHTTWDCKYHIVFAPKFRRKAIYGKYRADIGKNIKRVVRMERSRNNRSTCVYRPRAYVRKDTAENECKQFYGIFERKEYVANIRAARRIKIQIRK